MKFANESAATAYRVLNKCAQEMEPAGPWRWRCVMQNGTRMNIAAAMDDSFLQLICRPDATRKAAPLRLKTPCCAIRRWRVE